MTSNKLFSAFIAFSLLFGVNVNAQDQINTITTAVPFLRIAPDARSGAMGDAGLATSPDPFSIHWNPAKAAFGDKDMAFGISYTPWLRELVGDIYAANVGGYKKLGNKQALSFSLMYFSLGTIQFTDINGQDIGQFNPREFKIDMAYSRKLSDLLSLGVALRYIYSNLASGQFVSGTEIKPGMSVAADVSLYYQKPIEIQEKNATLSFGTNISNIGSKVTYTNSADKDFIPTNLGIGAALNVELDDYNKILITSDINKLLVPSPDSMINGVYEYKNQSVASGMFSSFADAPGGGTEELREIMYSFGAEYWYDNQFAVRGGYFHEHATKGNRKYITAGLGLKLNVFGIGVSYLVPTNSQRNPLDNTLRFSLNFDFESFTAQYKKSGGSESSE